MNSSRENSKYDLVVIGAGPGGYTAAFRAADLGLKTALIEKHETLGGVCLNVGCIPSKALLHVAHVIDQAKDLASHGVSFEPPTIDRARIADWKKGVVAQLTSGLGKMAKQRKIDIEHGTAKFIGSHQLNVESASGNKTIDFDKAIIATGSRASRLPFLPGDERIMHSTGALELNHIPKRLLVVGGGIIGLEMATVYNALGSSVTVAELTKSLIPGCDADLVRPLERHIKKSYENIFKSTSVTRAEGTDEGLAVWFEGKDAPKRDVFDKVLVSVGRSPNSQSAGLDKADIKINENGFIPVDMDQRTNIEHIFAIGDVTEGPMLAHKAAAEGKVAAEVAAGRKSGLPARVIPSVAYTDPEIAWVGLSENEAAGKGINVGKGKFPWAASGRSLSMGRNEGMTKLLFDEHSKRLVGAGFVGPGASELVAEAALAIEMGADATDIGLTIHPHPTLSESFAMAAEVYEGTVTDLFIPKRK